MKYMVAVGNGEGLDGDRRFDGNQWLYVYGGSRQQQLPHQHLRRQWAMVKGLTVINGLTAINSLTSTEVAGGGNQQIDIYGGSG